MTEPENLFERVAGQHDRDTFGRQFANELIDLFFRTDIETARRMIEHENPAARETPLREHDFLLIAAR